MTSSDLQRREVFYSGRVQGVGFRWTARQIARSHTVTGFVRNLDDGRVQLVAEGEPDEINGFLAAIAERMEGYIRQAHETKSPATGQFATFEIVH